MSKAAGSKGAVVGCGGMWRMLAQLAAGTVANTAPVAAAGGAECSGCAATKTSTGGVPSRMALTNDADGMFVAVLHVSAC